MTPGPYYEEKIVRGLTNPVSEYLSKSEIQQTLNGRYRGDGRRQDQYVLPDPMGFDQ